MAEPELFAFGHKELVTMMIKHQDIHSGIWELYVEFGLAAQNIQFVTGTKPEVTDHASPAAIVSLNKVGIRKIPALTPLSVDASEVNPKTKRKK